VINFRYHVVSLTAVFLALAIGLVVGTAALNGPVADSLNDNVNALRKDNKQLRETVGSLRDEVNREEDFAVEAAPIMLDGKLAGRRILLICLPTGRDYIDGVSKMLTTAGAKITGRVDIQDKFTNPDNSVDLLALARRVQPPSIPAGAVPSNSDGVETSGALLASVLVDRSPAVSDADLKSVLNAYTTAGYLTVENKVTGPAQAVVVVSGLPYVDRDAPAKNDAVVTAVAQFDKAGPIVVAGNGVGDGNVVAAVRGDPTLSKTISTVDNVPTAQGQVVTAVATTEQVARNKAGHYGLGSGASSLMPKLPE
jgi:hypothetical protein